jgi:hypothetical protein
MNGRKPGRPPGGITPPQFDWDDPDTWEGRAYIPRGLKARRDELAAEFAGVSVRTVQRWSPEQWAKFMFESELYKEELEAELEYRRLIERSEELRAAVEGMRE